MAITYLDEEQPKSKITYLDEEQPKAVEKKPLTAGDRLSNYFFPQAITGAKLERGERTLMGDIFERPAAAVRSGIIEKTKGGSFVSGYKKGAAVPEEVPRFQDIALSKYYQGDEKPSLLKTIGGFGVSAGGLAADVATDPTTYLTALFGLGARTPSGKAITKSAGEELGKAGKLVKMTTEEILKSPLAETAKRGFVNATEGIKSLGDKLPKIMNREWLLKQSENTSQVADDTIKGIQEEYRHLYDDVGIGKMEVNKTELKEIIYSTMKGATKEEADDILKNLKVNLAPQSMGSYELSPNLDTVQKIKTLLQKDIPESVWMKGQKGFDLTPAQSRKVNAYFRLKNITEKTLAGTEEGEYLKYLDKKATNTYRLTKVIKRMVIDQTGQPSETGRLVRAFSGKPEQAGRENWFYQLKELNKDAQEIITNMNKFRQRQAAKKIAATATGGYGVYELGKRVFGK